MADLLIKGMEMPKTCADCRLFFIGRNVCALIGRIKFFDEGDELRTRHQHCPLVECKESPGGFRLIDANRVTMAKFSEHTAYMEEYARGWNDALDAIKENAPTINAVEIYGTDIVRCYEIEGMH